jgi:hypothetical protein
MALFPSEVCSKLIETFNLMLELLRCPNRSCAEQDLKRPLTIKVGR